MRLPAALIRLACLAANMGFLIDTFIFWIVQTLKKWRRQTLEREALDWPRTPGIRRRGWRISATLERS